MMENEKIVELFNKKAELLREASVELSIAYRLYAYELLFGENGSLDIDKIRSVVEATSHGLEKMYREYEDKELSYIDAKDKDGYDKTIYEVSVFTAVMCIASRVYDNLVPVFSRDIMHAALDAAHFLMSRQFKENDSEEKEATETGSVLRMSSRDDVLSQRTVTSLAWGYAELLKTDKDIRNAYDHSLMAGMPQKMSRQKRYKLRLSDLIKRLSDDSIDDIDNSIKVLLSLTVLLDTEDIFSDEVKKVMSEYLYKMADSLDDEMFLAAAILSLQHELYMDEQIVAKGSQLIKVVEYNVIGGGKKQMSEEEKKRIIAHIEELKRKIRVI